MRQSAARLAMIALGLVSPIAPARAAEPAVGTRYGSFPAARIAAQRLITHALGADADSAKWRRGTSAFQYRDQLRLAHDAAGKPMWFEEARDSLTRVPSLTITLEKASGSSPDEEVRAAFEHSGWVEDGRYGADGEDGTTFAMVCREALCFVEGRWEGGDPTDTTYVPKPGFRLTVTCVPRPSRLKPVIPNKRR